MASIAFAIQPCEHPRVGAFYLVSRAAGADWRHIADSLHVSFEEQGFRKSRIVDSGNFILGVFGKLNGDGPPNLVSCPDGNNTRIAAAVGTLFVDDRIGKPGLRLLLHDTLKTAMRGNYCLLRGTENSIDVTVDELGLYKVYSARNSGILSSSFLAMTRSLPKLSLNAQCLYEYVFQGATYGGETIFNEISILDPACSIRVAETITCSQKTPPHIPNFNTNLSETRLRIIEELSSTFRAIAAQFGDRVDTALSAGFDSRLILALLRRQGLRPRLHVYGNDSDIDVEIARQIASGEGFSIEHINKSAIPWPDDAQGIIHTNYLLLDGLPTDGIFNNGSDAKSRQQRVHEGRLALNGGGGEIFRNFFYLPNRKVLRRELLHAFYCRYDKSALTSEFDERIYLDRLDTKLSMCFDHDSALLRREEVEWAYPYFRCRFWMGRNNSLNNRFGFALTPLVDIRTSLLSATIPIAFKNSGWFTSMILREIDPDLAKYPSAYGFNFAGSIPVKAKLAAHAGLRKPIWLRKNSFAIRNALRRSFRVSAWIDSARVEAAMPIHDPWTAKYFLHHRLRDEGQLQRMWTAEYVVRQQSDCSI